MFKVVVVVNIVILFASSIGELLDIIMAYIIPAMIIAVIMYTAGGINSLVIVFMLSYFIMEC